MTHCTPAQARKIAESIEFGMPQNGAAPALRSLADQLEQATLQHIAEPVQQQFALDALIAAGFVTQAKVDEALELAKPHIAAAAAAPAVPAPGALTVDAMKKALAALRANDEWHVDYDEHDGYPGSVLCTENNEAITLLLAALDTTTQPQAAPVAQLSEPPNGVCSLEGNACRCNGVAVLHKNCGYWTPIAAAPTTPKELA